MRRPLPDETVAQALLRLLDDRGCEFLVAAPGLDTGPFVDALVRLADDRQFRLRALAVPHPAAAVALAHGVFACRGRTPAVLFDGAAGAAQAAAAVFNAAAARVPLLLLAGRPPWHEDAPGAGRDHPVQWGRDAIDPAGGLRPWLKWEHEVRSGRQLEAALDRALALAVAVPAGPVLLTLPRDVLAASAADLVLVPAGRITPPGPTLPAQEQITAAANILATAERPLAIVSEVGRYPDALEALSRLSSVGAIPVIENGRRFLSFPTSHQLHLGFVTESIVKDADAILVAECPVPWTPRLARPRPEARVIQLGVEPLYGGIALRDFSSHLTIRGHPALALQAIAEELAVAVKSRRPVLDDRRRLLVEVHVGLFKQARELAAADAALPRVTKRFLSYALGRVIDPDCVIFNESALDPLVVDRDRPGGWFEASIAGVPGFALAAALGGRLALPADRTVVAALGDVAYLQAEPLVCHQVSTGAALPVLTVVFNDGAASTVRKLTRAAHPDGWAARRGQFPLTEIGRLRLDRAVEAAGGRAFRVDKPADLEPTLRKALAEVRTHAKQALVDVACDPDG